jgi:prepilin-type N-terminal cleavage/methylation domain-containing protein
MKRGFTMIEMIVVTLIVLFIMGTGITLLNGASRAQSNSTRRISDTESARLTFQLLARDLESAYAGPNSPGGMIKGRVGESDAYPAAGSPVPIVVTDPGPPSTDILHFYTKADTANITDEYVFVRYYVHSEFDKDGRLVEKSLCRQVLPFVPLEDTPPEHTDPTTLTAINGDPFPLFSGVQRLVVVYREWDASKKEFTPSSSDLLESTNIPACTHLKVTLFMDNQAMYTKVIPLPSTF